MSTEKNSVQPANGSLISNVKEWYMHNYFWDELGGNLKDNVTFSDVRDALENGQDIYEVLGFDADTIVRERVFGKLAELLHVEYDYVYQLWLDAVPDNIGLEGNEPPMPLFESTFADAVKRSEATFSEKEFEQGFEKE